METKWKAVSVTFSYNDISKTKIKIITNADSDSQTTLRTRWIYGHLPIFN